MEVPTDFAQRIGSIAESTPRNVLENLIMGLMPRVAVTARRVPVDNSGSPLPKLDSDGYLAKAPDGMVRKLMRGPRTRQPRGAAYTVADARACRNHRAGTWTYAMVRAATAYCDDPEQAMTTRTAQEMLRLHFPQFADRSIDFNWLAKVGYITLNR